MKHFSAADAWLKKVSGSQKDHILATIFYQSLCHWGPETSGSRCNRLRCPLARMSGLQCFNMGHNGHGINLYGVSMILMGN